MAAIANIIQSSNEAFHYRISAGDEFVDEVLRLAKKYHHLNHWALLFEKTPEHRS